MTIARADSKALTAQLSSLEADFAALKARGLSLDLTRGKPASEQLALSEALDGILDGDEIVATQAASTVKDLDGLATDAAGDDALLAGLEQQRITQQVGADGHHQADHRADVPGLAF